MELYVGTAVKYGGCMNAKKEPCNASISDHVGTRFVDAQRAR